MNRGDDFAGLLKAAMAKRGIEGEPAVEFIGEQGQDTIEVVLHFMRSDGKISRVSVGSKLVANRSAEHLANIAADRMAEAYAHDDAKAAGIH